MEESSRPDDLKKSHVKKRKNQLASRYRMANILTIICVLIIIMSVAVIFDSVISVYALIIVIAVFAAYVGVSSMILKHIVFDPIKLLTRSISEDDDENTGIYGVTRDDEIGELARETRKVWSHINENADVIMTFFR